MHTMSIHTKFLMFFAAAFGVAVFTSVALTNLAVLGLVLLSPLAWHEFYKKNQSLDKNTKLFLGLVLALCVWDVLTNLNAGFGASASIKALLHDMRTFGFIVLLWAVFCNPAVSRVAFWALVTTILLYATINLVATLAGLIPKGDYFTTLIWQKTHMSHLSHMYGQALVGVVLVLAQMWLVRPQRAWQVAIPLLLLLASLFLASSRRTGWLLLAAGFVVWFVLNAKRMNLYQYKWWCLAAIIGLVGTSVNADVVQQRMAEAVMEFKHYLALTPQERSAAVFGSVSIRMQFAATAWETIKQSNPWFGVGSIGFPQAYQAAATSMEVTPQSWATYNWGNPHNEYLYMLATKGVIGLALYLAVFAQACRVAWQKTDDVQRIGLVVFVFLFMLSITTNSMMIDMEEGHFTMLILLVFLAPKSINLRDGKQ